MFGDKNINFSEQYPTLFNAIERALHLAQDPVAARNFFEFTIHAIFDHLFGWYFNRRDCKPNGGILGHLKAWTGTVELTERVSFHG